MNMNRRHLLLILFCSLFLIDPVFGGITENSAYRDKTQLVTNYTFSATDASYTLETTPADYSVSREGWVRLSWQRKRTDVASGGSGATWWTYRVFYKIYATSNPSVFDTSSVLVAFMPEGTAGAGTSIYEHINKHAYNDPNLTIQVTGVAAYTFSGGTYTAVTTPSTSSSIPSDIRLELIVHTEKYRDIYSNTSTVTRVRFDAPGSGANPGGSPYGLVTWDYIEGAEEYDLEWVYVDDKTTHSTFTNPEDPFEFKTPTRITTSNQFYEVPLTYPSGTLYFRVRGVGRFISSGNDLTKHDPGEWSYKPTPLLSPISYTISTDFEENKNWQYTIAFAEEGKRKQVMTYYDGSLRSRQAATDVSSDETVLVGESKYDYEGRGTVAILPAPVYSKSLGYRDNFTLDATTAALFDKDNFDEGTSEQVGNTSGAGEYYSAYGTSGQFADQPFRSFVPDAGGWTTGGVTTDGGYPYVQTLYMRDGTGRVAKQSGVGPDHAIGSGHETKYYYGSATSTELHRMFGTNVGYASHYKKTMVMDPNGQESVAYMDQEGRTVATALTGTVPQNLIALDSYDPQTITASLNDNNIIDPYTHTSTNITHLLNPIESPGCTNTYSFSYDMTGAIYTNSFTSIAVDLPATDPPTYISVSQCADCKYKLDIQVFDPDGIPVTLTYMPGNTNHIQETFENASAPNCASSSFHPTNTTVDFHADFCKAGDYTVVKVLTLDTTGIAAEIADALDASGLGTGYLANLTAYLQNHIDSSLCDISCGQHCKTLIMQEHPEWDTTSSTFHDAVADCEATYCGGFVTQVADTFANYQCQTILQNIILQVSPGGIFYDETDPAGSGSTSAYFWDRVEAATISFHNPDGTVMAVQPSIATVQDPATFQQQWAYDIAPYHREYCHYTNCTGHDTSSSFDFKMALIATWSDAATTGYLNPTGLNYTNFSTNYSALSSPWDASSVYTSITGSVSDPYTLPASSLNNDPTYGNIWDYAANAANYTSAFPFTDANRWQMFRGLYLQIKTNYIRNAEIGSCPYYSDDYAIVKDPGGSVTDLINTINSQSQTYSSTVWDYTTICEQNADQWMDSLSRCCDLDTNHYSLAALNVIRDSLIAFCSRSAGMHNPLGIMTDDMVANGELNHVLTLMNALSPVPPCMSDTDFTCVTDVIVYQDTCIHDTITHYFVTDCFKEMLSFVNAEVLPVYDGAGTNICYDLSDPDYDFTPCSLSGNTILRVDSVNDDFDLSKPGTCSSVQCAMGLRFYDNAGNIIPVADMTSFGTASFLQYYPCGSCSPTGTFRKVQLTINTPYGPVQGYAFSDNLCGLNFVDSVTVDTCLAMLDTTYGNYQFSFDDLQQECIEQLQAQAAWNAQAQYAAIVHNFTQQWLTNHYSHCFGTGFSENFKVEYKDYEHHFTLYYYDQADNLVRTVPPAGYVPTDWTNFDSNGVYNGTGEPDHREMTDYTYNSLNEALTAKSPDGGTTVFFYDLKGRIVASQNAKQEVTASSEKRYSYTTYDERSRIKEVGQTSITTSNLLTTAVAQNDADFATWLAAGTHSQIVKTFYDEQAGSPPSGLMARFYDGQQDHLRSRVSYTEFYEDDASTLTNAVYYSYDIHGNVKEMVTDDPTLDDLGDDARFKHLAYGYDLISGKVNYVSYQHGKPDQFWHRYVYDADNRLTVAETSSDSTLWERDAKYFYYLHGSLARTEIGHDKIQGEDYAYTLHGLIKGVNSNTLVATRDMGQDGKISGANITSSDLNGGSVVGSNINNLIAQDAFGYTLGYYENDYHSIGTSTFDAVGAASSPLNAATTDLFNGNISNWVMAMENTSEARLKTFGKLFAYDQLNRIKTSDVYNDISGATDNVLNNNSFAGAGSAFDYHEDFNYDPNGNILEANRNGNFIGGSNPMDNLTYYYKRSGGGTYQWNYGTTMYVSAGHNNDLPSDATNQLDHVDETASGTGSYTGDVEDQSATNYTYDEIGNLKSDVQEEIANIEWTVFGKIRKITRTSTSNKPDLEFRYNAMGTRICKIVKPKDPATHLVLDQRDWTYTYYTHDATGNVMAVYDRDLANNGGNVDDKITLKEQDLYASSRVGLKRPLNDDRSAIVVGGFTFTPGTPGADGIIPVSATVGSISASNLPSGMRWMTRKQYELSNHLGNVYAVVSDKKIGIENTTTSATSSVAYYTADVLSATDYFAFGAPENGRIFNSTDYRYGFNGEEKDDEITGDQGTDYDLGARVYDARLGKMFSIDPLVARFPWQSSYAYCANDPTTVVDKDGMGPPQEPETAEPITGKGTSGAGMGRATIPGTNGILIQTRPPSPNDAMDAVGFTPAGTPYGQFVLPYDKSMASVAISNIPAGYDVTTWVTAFTKAGANLALAEEYYHSAIGTQKMTASGINVNAMYSPPLRIVTNPAQLSDLELIASKNRILKGQAHPQDYLYVGEMLRRNCGLNASKGAGVPGQCDQYAMYFKENAASFIGTIGATYQIYKYVGDGIMEYDEVNGQATRVATNGYHYIVEVTFSSGQVYIFDNLHPNGVSATEWKKRFIMTDGGRLVRGTDLDQKRINYTNRQITNDKSNK